ncbi:hypothetical protein L9F63_011003, partial [Diploptera punctata]
YFSSLCALLQMNTPICNSQNKFILDFIEKRLQFPKCYKAQNEKSSLPITCGRDYDKPGNFMHIVEDILEHECDLVDTLQGSDRSQNQLADE